MYYIFLSYEKVACAIQKLYAITNFMIKIDVHYSRTRGNKISRVVFYKWMRCELQRNLTFTNVLTVSWYGSSHQTSFTSHLYRPAQWNKAVAVPCSSTHSSPLHQGTSQRSCKVGALTQKRSSYVRWQANVPRSCSAPVGTLSKCIKSGTDFV